MNYWKFFESFIFFKHFFLYSSKISFLTRNNIWLYFLNGFYFDDLFSLLIKSTFENFFLIPSFFLFDKWFSFWTGFGFLKFYIKTFSNLFLFDKFDFYFMLLYLILTVIFFFLFFFFLFFFLI